MPTVIAATQSLASTWWLYVLLFLAVMISWAGVPLIGAAAAGAAGVAASQGKLNVVAVAVVSTVAGEVGGLIGYAIGDRWGRQLLERPGKTQARRQRLVEKGERAYVNWGWLAVFFTPAFVSGAAKMRHREFVIFNFLDSLAFSVSVVASAYGIGRLATGHHSAKDVLSLFVGLAAGAGAVWLYVRHRRRIRAESPGEPVQAHSHWHFRPHPHP